MYVQDERRPDAAAPEETPAHVAAKFLRTVPRVMPQLPLRDVREVYRISNTIVDEALEGCEIALVYMRLVIAQPQRMLDDYRRVYVSQRAVAEQRRPMPHRSARVRVPQTRPRERRPGSARRTSRSAARQSAGDSSPPGEPPRPAPRPARYSFACLPREQRGETS